MIESNLLNWDVGLSVFCFDLIKLFICSNQAEPYDSKSGADALDTILTEVCPLLFYSLQAVTVHVF